MSARRSLLTASAAGALLGALWFVPSANATDDMPTEHRTREYRTQTTTTAVLRTTARTDAGASEGTVARTTGRADASTSTGTATSTDVSGTDDVSGTADTSGSDDGTSAGTHTRLADTGSFDTTPYVAGGTLFLSLGAGFVAYSVRRERTTAH
ncbi:hypothetical protein [Streptomyces beigongshangae]|uniref:hypothetical protein n=1 Tax=Streptomyces beigongshangae TaxID=2841597 RepID=UPI0027E02620|nr:hypothetical protein [Streptomyces sp. REN17]